MIAAGRGWWQGLALELIELDRFFDDLAELFEDLLLVVTMATAEKQARSAADIATVDIRPFDDLDVSRTRFHDRDSLMALLTAAS